MELFIPGPSLGVFDNNQVGCLLRDSNTQLIQTLIDPFREMKSRCIPTETDEEIYQKRIVYYLATIFPETDLQSPSFNGSPQFMNLLVDDQDTLLKLVFRISDTKSLPPVGQFIVEALEYSVPGKPIVARKFVSYQ